MKDLGEAKKILGIKTTRDKERGKICLTHKQYLKKILQCFNISEQSKHVSNPLAPHIKLSASLSPCSLKNESVCLEFHMLMMLVV